MPPSFGVKYPFASKLFPNYNYFLQADTPKALHAVATINPASRLLRWGHLINMSVYPFPLSSPQLFAFRLFPSLFKNSSAPPPPNSGASTPTTKGFPKVLRMASISEIPQVQQLLFSLALPFQSAACDCSGFFSFSAIISRPLGIRSSFLCLSNLAWSC